MPDSKKKYPMSFKIFKPRNNGEGAASQWELNKDKECMFVEFALQNETKDHSYSFDWNNKAIMKLGLTDIGEILATLTDLQNGMGPLDGEGRSKGIYHQTPKGNTILQLAKNKKTTGYFIRLSQKLQGQDPKVFQHAITFAEVSLLIVLLRRAIQQIYDW